METRDLWAEPADCCGCGACAARCPKGAISMEEGSDGFVYPHIDAGLCVDCGLCKKVCGLQNRYAQETDGPWYAASYRGDSSRSASAGAFYALARSIVETGGVVFGAAYIHGDDGIRVRHIMAQDLKELCALQGSKYVQSDAGSCFPEVRRHLEAGSEVLFSGTPCQVAGLRGYLGRDWPKLVTVDLVCHGVPSERLFRSLVKSLERKYSKRVIDLRFRSKSSGWGHSALSLSLKPFDDVDSVEAREVIFQADDFAYYDLFLNVRATLRDSCYACPFAAPVRPADITVGDFWGVRENRPDVLEDLRYDSDKGVSCLLVNTERGRTALSEYGGELDLFEVSFEDIAKGNDHLRHPSELPSDRVLYLKAFSNGGWDAVEELWKKRERGASYMSKKLMKRLLPKGLIRHAKTMLEKKRSDEK